MVAGVDVFSPGTVLGIVGNLKGTTVVLEDFAVHISLSGLDRETKLLHFLKEPDDRQGVLESL